jgi:cytochrome c oxidase subunit IV
VSAPTTTAPPPPPAPSDQPQPTRAGRVVLGLLLVLGGVAWLLDLLGVATLEWRLLLPAALVLVGLTLIITAWHGSHGGLVAFGILLSALVMLPASLPIVTPLAGVGDRTEQPRDVEDLADTFELGIGKLTVDARRLDLDGETVSLAAHVGIGEVVVLLPDDAAATIDVRSGMGEAAADGRTAGGFAPGLDRTLSGERGAGQLDVDVSVGIGRAEVQR